MKWRLKRGKRGASVGPQAGRKEIHPVRDWMVGLGIATFIFLSAAAAIAYDFRVQFVLPPELTATTTVDVVYSDRDVEQYAERFNAKDARFNALRAEVGGGPSPALEEEDGSGASPDSLAPEDPDRYTDPALSL